MISRQYIESVPQKSGPFSEVIINCPECDDTSGHMYCNMSKMLYHCFKCGASGKIVDDEYFDLKNYHTVTGRLSGVEENLSYSSEVRKIPIRNLPPSNDAYKDIQFAHPGIMYLQNRGVTNGELRDYRIRIGNWSRYPFIIFPIYIGKELVYFVSRRYVEGKPKYINASWPKEDTFYVVDGHGPIVLCEGVFDALAIGRVGYEAWAILGKECTGKQLQRLDNFKGRCNFLIYLDDDAFSHAINLKIQLNSLGVKTHVITHHKDAADLYLEDNGKTLRRLLDEGVKALR